MSSLFDKYKVKKVWGSGQKGSKKNRPVMP